MSTCSKELLCFHLFFPAHISDSFVLMRTMDQTFPHSTAAAFCNRIAQDSQTRSPQKPHLFQRESSGWIRNETLLFPNTF